MKETILLFLKGVAVGVANIIPGVSGGTMAVVLGIYERLVSSIGGLLSRPAERKSILLFLGLITIGAIVGVLLFAKGITWALEEHRILTLLFFMGLILGSIPPVIKMSGIKRLRIVDVAFIALGVAAVLALGSNDQREVAIEVTPALIEAAEEAPSLPEVKVGALLITGICAGGAMIVPGVSGSLVLLLLGHYYTATAAISVLIDSLIDSVKLLFSGDFNAAISTINWDAVMIVALVGVGAVVGVAVFAKLIELALRKAHLVTYSFIIGLVAGSILVLNPGLPGSLGGALAGILMLAGGAVISFGFSGETRHS